MEFLEDTLQAFSRGGRVFSGGFSNAGIAYGSAGAALGLLRIAESRGDAQLLALAGVWGARASAVADREDAFFDKTSGLSRKSIGDVTPYFQQPGVYAARAIVAGAMGDTPAQQRAVDAFVTASKKPCENLDPYLGRSASLFGAAVMLAQSDRPELRAYASATMSSIWSELDAWPAVAESRERTFFGIAHGWAGHMYAALRWCAVSGDALPARLTGRLDEFAACGTVEGRGVRWPVRAGEPRTMSGWCNGSAGQVYLFVLAHRLFGEERWLRLAEMCAWRTWDLASPAKHHFCCGSAGRAYALLHLYKYTGAREWLGRARQLANEAAAGACSGPRADTLWVGNLGIAVLIADLASPGNARMPFFE